MDITYAATLIRAWVSRRAAKGIVVTADDIWTRINAKWPTADEWQRDGVSSRFEVGELVAGSPAR